MSDFRQGLIDEIGFWRELISESGLSVDSPEYKRMEYALRLAEIKLANHEQALADCVSESPKARASLFISELMQLITNNKEDWY